MYCLVLNVSRFKRLCRFSNERGSNEEVVCSPAGFAKEFRGRHFGWDIFKKFLLFQVIEIRESVKEQWEKTRRCFGGGDGRWSCNFGSGFLKNKLLWRIYGFSNFTFAGYILLNSNEVRPPKLYARSAPQAGDRIEGLPEFAHEVLHIVLHHLPMNTSSVYPLSHHHRKEIGCSKLTYQLIFEPRL